MNNQVLKRRAESGWQSGLWSLLRREFGWWKTRSGLLQFGIWIFVINGLLAMFTFVATIDPTIVAQVPAILFQILPLFTTLGILVIAQGAIIQERQSGTAAWVLSAPVSRPAFFLSKLIPLALGNFIAMIIIPGVIAYLQLTISFGGAPSVIPFSYGLALVTIHLLFYLTLALMGGTIFNSRVAVVGIGFGVFIGGSILSGFLPETVTIFTPWLLGGFAPIVAQGQAIPSPIPVFATITYLIVFIAVGLWRFSREEF